MPENQDSNKRHNRTTWKKGQSGNPSGRPKKPDCLMDCIRQELGKKVPGRDETWEQLIAKAWLTACLKGNVQAINSLTDRLYGKPKESLEIKQQLTVRNMTDGELEAFVASHST